MIAEATGASLSEVEARWRSSRRSIRRGSGAQPGRMPRAAGQGADRYDPAMARLIDNLDLLAKGRMKDLKRICGVDDEDLADMIRELRAYDPKPGCRFAQGRRAVTPDVFIRRTKAASRSSSTRRRCRGCWSTAAITAS